MRISNSPSTKQLGLVFLTLVSLPLLSCQSLRVAGPMAILESPEIDSESSGHRAFILKAEPANSYLLSSAVAGRPFVAKNNQSTTPTHDLVLGMNFAISNRWQWGVASSSYFWIFNGYTLSGRLMVKYSILGEPYSGHRTSSHLLSVFGHLIGSETNLHGDQRYLFSEGGYPWNAQGNYRGISAGMSYGYRWSDQWMTYLSVATQVFSTGGKVHQAASATGDFPEVNYVLGTESGRNWSAGGGLLFGVRNRFCLNYSYSENSWGEFKDNIYALSLGLSILNFDKLSDPVQPYRKSAPDIR